MTDKCDHKWWALRRSILGKPTEENETRVSRGLTHYITSVVEVEIMGQKMIVRRPLTETYGKRCEYCGAERIFAKPVPDNEIEWAKVSK